MKVKISFEADVAYFDATEIQPLLEEMFNGETTVVETDDEEEMEEEEEEGQEKDEQTDS